MGSRGRTSLAAVHVSPVARVDRLPPPAGLTDEQAEEWVAIVNTMPADHFMRGNQGLLEQYCRHMVTARHIAAMIEMFEAMPVGQFILPKGRAKVAKGRRPRGSIRETILTKLYSQQEKESSIIKVLLTAMRLTQQSIYRGETVKHPKMGASAKPWDEEAA